MTEQEKVEILNELEERLVSKYKGCLTREDTQSVLKQPREKWFRNDTGSSIIAWQVWETIRKLTCVVCRKQYVRHLGDVPNADVVAEKICQFVYDLKTEQREKETVD